MMNKAQVKTMSFVSYAKRIIESDQKVSVLKNDQEIDELISGGIYEEELTKAELEQMTFFAECCSDTEKVAFLFFILLDLINSKYCFKCFAEYVYMHRNQYSIYTQYFLYAQILDMAARDGYVVPDDYALWIFEMSKWYIDLFQEELSPIAYKDRKKDLVLVITSQFLGIRHSATKLTLDVCRGIILSGRSLLLINLADALSLTGGIPYWNVQANYVQEYSKTRNFIYEDVNIPFAQCDRGMPNKGMMKDLICELRELKPEIIISIGEDIFSNVIDEMIPVCSIPLQAKLSRNFTKYLVHYNDLTLEETEWIKDFGYQDNNLIRIKLPFRIDYSNGMKRADLGIPEDAFCIVAIGNRLDSELTEDLLIELDKFIKETGAFFLVIGKMDCQTKFRNYANVLNRCGHLEYTQKLLAVCKLTDLYLNPPREGGGTSALYAMSAGKPIVSLNYGDVYKNCGEEFSVQSISEMFLRIKKYMEDSTYYSKMSELALRRAQEYEDVEKNIEKLMNTLEIRERI